jgi:enediyne polyketide synthase
MRRTLAPKTLGLQTALEVLAPALRHLVTFGSIIGRIGLEGEAHYALANAMQTAATQAWAAAAPGRAALAIEWSLWGGAGMGERLGTIERLESQGVDALSIDGALDAFDGLLAGNATGSAIVTSRFGPPPALSLGAAELPIMRFLDQPLVHYPGVELVVETSISQGRDPYLVDHAIDGVATLPGVIGLEAMAQSASALMALGDHVNVSRIAFARALQIREGADLRVRIAALRTGDRVVEACLFAADDNFAVPCMHATFSAGFAEQAPRPPMQAEASIEATSLYGALFFGSGRFCRVARFERIDSRRVQATLGPDPGTKWFGAYEPDGTVLWDPGAADASLHALQAAVPHRRVIPVSVQRIAIDRTANPPIFISAVERTASSGTYVFDIIATDEQGRTAYRWECVTFRAVGTIDIFPVLSAAPLLSRPYLERIARERLGDDTIAVAVVHGSGGSRDSRRASALQALGATGKLERRGDGRPLRIEQTGSISLSHGDEISIAVTSDTPIGCDIEAVAACKDTDLEDLRRHVAFEVCRKLGRRPDPAFDAPAAGSAALINDVVLTIAELPTPSGPHAVGFGCLREPAVSAVQPFTFPISEAPP